MIKRKKKKKRGKEDKQLKEYKLTERKAECKTALNVVLTQRYFTFSQLSAKKKGCLTEATGNWQLTDKHTE